MLGDNCPSWMCLTDPHYRAGCSRSPTADGLGLKDFYALHPEIINPVLSRMVRAHGVEKVDQGKHYDEDELLDLWEQYGPKETGLITRSHINVKPHVMEHIVPAWEGYGIALYRPADVEYARGKYRKVFDRTAQRAALRGYWRNYRAAKAERMAA